MSLISFTPLQIIRPFPTLEETIAIANMLHVDQKDKRGEPCILHVLRVGLESGPDPVNMTIGFLHDIVEDTPATLKEILENYGPEVADAVDALTHRPNEDYFAYIDRLKKNSRARFVKMVDLTDNMAPWRQDFKGADVLFQKHERAYEMLLDETARAISEEVAQNSTRISVNRK